MGISFNRKEITIDGTHTATHRRAWKTRKLGHRKAPFKLQETWGIRIRLQMQGRLRELAMFDLGIDSKLRACVLVNLRVRDVAPTTGCPRGR